MKHIAIYLLLFFPLVVCGQTGIPVFDSLSHRLIKQRYEFPQEKVHVLTDKPYYMGGDTIWFRAFVVDATSHEPVHASRYLYAELRTPFDSLEIRVKIKEHDGIYAGYMALPSQMPEGDYTFCAYTLFMENTGEPYFFRKNLQIHSPFATQSSINARFDKEDKILSATLTYTDKNTGANKPYNEMIYSTADGKTRLKRKGEGEVVLYLSEKEAQAGYLYVSFNNYKKYLRIPPLSDDYTVSFHPEGGYLVSEVPCSVGFKAITSSGTSELISGKLVNSAGEEVTKFETLHAGMGLFTFIPRRGELYRAICRDSSGTERSFTLPVTEPDAKVLKVSYPDKKTFTVSILGNRNKNKNFHFIIHQRGKLLYSKQWPSNEEYLLFKRENFTPGILQLLLLDTSGNTLSERMLFIRDHGRNSITVRSDQKQYGSREKVKLDVTLKNFKIAEGDYAVSITDMHSIIPDTTYSIESSLLLSSELRGFIESPAYYFDNKNVHVEQSLDALLLTQGWRRYDIPSVLQGKFSIPSNSIEIGQEITGKVASALLSKSMQNATVKILAPGVGYADIFYTDSLGQFHCNGFDFPDSTRFIIQAFTKRGKQALNIKIDTDRYPATHFYPVNISGSSSSGNDFSLENYINQEKRRYQYSEGLKSILLDEITITAAKRKKAEDIFETLSDKTFRWKEMEEMKMTSIEEVIRKIPGLNIMNHNLMFRQGTVAIFIDGVYREPLVLPGANQQDIISTPYEDLVQQYPFDIIKRIDFLKPNEAVLLGQYATPGGALLITTKRGENNEWKQPLHLQSIIPLGYQKAAEFYSPKYETAQQKKYQGYDLRNTLYWNPGIKCDKNGHSTIEFYTSDVPDTQYMIRIEGITKEGEVIQMSNFILKD